MPQVFGQFANAIKGKRNVDSMQAAIDTELARCKLDASAMGNTIIANLRAMGFNGHLFPDLRTVCTKPSEDFVALLAKRQADAAAATAAARVKQAEADAKLFEAVTEAVKPAAEPAKVVDIQAVKEVEHQAVIEHDAEIRAFLDERQPPEKLRGTIRAYLVSFVQWQAARALKTAA